MTANLLEPGLDPDVAAIARIGSVQTILEVVTQATGLRLVLIARVTDEDWKACAVHDAMAFGLITGAHLDVGTTLCREVRDSKKPILIEHASQDATWCEHKTPKIYGFESYVAVPIFLADGDYFGNICALDYEPLPLRERRSLEMVEAFAKLIGLQLDVQRQADLREQFIAVLGHDLRSPLHSIMMGAQFLQRASLPEPSLRVVESMQNSTTRMAQLVDDVMDFARGRLGDGMHVESATIDDLGALVRHVTTELGTAHPSRELRAKIDPIRPVQGDRVRLGQLFSNLLANAIQHGTPGTPVDIAAEQDESEVVIRVSNMGAPIPEEKLARIFEPYVRGKTSGHAHGLGLGLYIASEIVRAHHGKLTVTSTADGHTTFRVVLPCTPLH